VLHGKIHETGADFFSNPHKYLDFWPSMEIWTGNRSLISMMPRQTLVVEDIHFITSLSPPCAYGRNIRIVVKVERVSVKKNNGVNFPLTLRDIG
jgi:hypothetical protein